MPEPKHTRGPWHYGEDRRGRKRVFAPDGREVVVARKSRTEHEANGLLIAAAPDLLDIATTFLAHYREPQCLEALAPIAQAIITKALGK